MRHYFWIYVARVFKARKYIIILICILLQSCQPKSINSQISSSKKDLSKAALLNIQLGLNYLKQGDRPKAKQKLLTALDEAPKSADAHAAMAYYLEQTNEIRQSEAYYSKAIAYSHNAGAQLNNYGAFLCRHGEYYKAETYFLNAIKDPRYLNTAAAYENAGLCAVAAHDYEKAKFYFTTALNHDPSRKTALYELVRLEQKKEQYKNALFMLQKYPELVLNDKIMLSLATHIASKAGQDKIAADYARYLADHAVSQ